jgi:hypothetical protein
MRNNNKPIRIAIFTALTGNIGGINMYDEKRKVSATDNTFIVFSTQQQTPDPDTNDCTWISRNSIDIEVYNKTGSEVTKNTVDDIVNTICEVLIPTPFVTPITSANLQFTNAYVESIISRNLSLSETESVMVEVIRFVVQVTQQAN